MGCTRIDETISPFVNNIPNSSNSNNNNNSNKGSSSKLTMNSIVSIIGKILGKKENEDPNKPWEVHIIKDVTIKNTNGLDNSITTTKYNIITWLPKSVFEQFRRIANVYFLGISILMLIGEYAPYIYVTPLDPYSTLGTLIFVLLVTSFKEGYEDLQRYRSDVEENNRPVTICQFEGNKITERKDITRNIKAGDIIKLEGKTSCPADMLIILTSNFADGNQCYVETANIDGETNLKLREAPAGLSTILNNGIPSLSLFSGRVEMEPPNKDIHNFIGALHVDSLPDPIALSANNIMLRSSLFSNTDWAYGIALYTGQETKIQMNNKFPPSKMSNLEGYLNRAIIIIFFAQIILVSITVISIYILGFENFNKFPYVYTNGSSSGSVLPLWLESWIVFFLLFNNFIPISLYVTIELVNVGQSYLIANDIDIYDETLNCPCAVRSSNLVQELGQISNVFSDKTGTLTRNEMKLVKFVVNGTMYEVPETPNPEHEVNVLMRSANKKDSKLYGFLRCLSTCHTVVREKDGTYRAESPDEFALVDGVSSFNCSLNERSTTTVTVQVVGERQVYEILAVNQFNSDRKRMSVLLKETVTGEYYVLCKGADSTTLPLCIIENNTLKLIDKSLSDLACFGLRTLCIAQKRLNKADALKWIEKYKAAQSSMQDRAAKIDAAAAEIEVDLEFLGLTAIEDKLQDEVPEVIADLAKAGVVVWMCTGDKEETAINIGRSCNLVTAETKLLFLTGIRTKEAYRAGLKGLIDDLAVNYLEGNGYRDTDGNIREITLVMDGPSFTYFDEDDKEQKQYLLGIGKKSRSVIGCRLTPIQKQQIVGLVRRESEPKSITLAIGDGANDVSMIREANIGIGIYGKEGKQAANSADVAIGQFKFLRNLMLVHGRWNYNRQSRAFLYCMHKNMVITLILYWFSYFTALSGTSPFESWVYTGFNFILGLPIIFYGIMDRDLSKKFILANPKVYSTGKDNTYLKVSSILTWIFNACFYAVVISLLMYYAVGPSFQYYSLFPMGTTVFVGMCNALQLKVVLLNHQWEWVRVFMMVLSVGGMLLYLNILSSYVDSDNYYVSYMLYNVNPYDSIFWTFAFFFIPLFVVYIDIFGNALKTLFWPTNEIKYYESEHLKTFESDPLVSKSCSSLNRTLSSNNLSRSELGSLEKSHSSSTIEMEKIYKNSTGDV